MTKYGNRKTPLERLLKEKNIDELRLEVFPDLLEVAKRVITEYNADWDMPPELIKMAREAVIKAEKVR